MRFGIRAVLRMLGSRRLATTLMLAWLALLVVWVVPFEFYGLQAAQLRTIIYSEPFFRLVYALLLLNVTACVLVDLAVISRRVSRMPSSDRKPNPGGDASDAEGVWDEQRAARALDDSGFHRRVVGDGWVWGVRRRFSPWGHVALHLGFFLIVAGAIVSMDPAAQTSCKAVVVEGETFDSAASEVLDIQPADAKIPDVRFAVDQVTARFHEDILLFTRLDALITDGDGRKRTVRVGTPWILDPFTMVSIEDYGYAPEVVVSSETTSAPATVYKLKAFPSGTPDYLQFRGLDDSTYNAKVSVYGDYVDRDGAPGAKSFNRDNPRFRVSIWRVRSDEGQTLVVDDVLVAVDQPIEFAGQSFTFVALREYGFFRFTRSSGLPLMALGLIVVAGGFVVALLMPRQTALIASQDSGVRVSVRDDAYRRASRAQSRLTEMWRSGS